MNSRFNVPRYTRVVRVPCGSPTRAPRAGRFLAAQLAMLIGGTPKHTNSMRRSYAGCSTRLTM
jgi:hypothetical protein